MLLSRITTLLTVIFIIQLFRFISKAVFTKNVSSVFGYYYHAFARLLHLLTGFISEIRDQVSIYIRVL